MGAVRHEWLPAADLFAAIEAVPASTPVPVNPRAVALDALLDNRRLWRGRGSPALSDARFAASGWPWLDAVLPGGGWPLGALCELLIEQPGLGELGLLMPALARVTQADGWVACVGAPWVPYAPALAAHGLDPARLMLVNTRVGAQPGKDALWAAEQCLRSGACAATLLWSDAQEENALRRLQLAAEQGGGLAFVLRGIQHLGRMSPAAVRVHLKAGDPAHLHVIKCRGGIAARIPALPWSPLALPGA